MRSAVLLFGLGMLATGGCDRDDLDYAVGTLERYRIELAADSGEPVTVLHVREGDRVTPGMALRRRSKRCEKYPASHNRTPRAMIALKTPSGTHTIQVRK